MGTPHRVTNDSAVLFGGSPRHKFVLLISRSQFSALARSDDFLTRISVEAPLVVVASATICPKGRAYVSKLTLGRDQEYESILRHTVLAVAERDGFTHVVWAGEDRDPVDARTWGPFSGVRRRGISARKRFQVARGLSGDHTVQVIEMLWRLFSLSRGIAQPVTDESALD